GADRPPGVRMPRIHPHGGLAPAAPRARFPEPLLMQVPRLLLRLAFLTLAFAGTSPAGGFKPGEIWPDTDGVHINAHGGGVLHHEGVYYWFGEHKTEGRRGNSAQVGVRCYSSTDLHRWKNEGVALA